jgi:hypothetical protein
MQEGFPLHMASSVVAGFSAVALSNPVDTIKSRMMVRGPDGQRARSTWHCIVDTARRDGPAGFYKGLVPALIRIGPHTIISFIVYEELRRLVGMRPV